MSDPLAALLERQSVVILDGGLATELEARGFDLADELWSARLLIENPDALRRLHRDYLEAGADCIVSASYQASVEGLSRRGLTTEESERLLRFSVELAVEARDAFWVEEANRRGRERPLVAASVGPYGAYLADGSEYRGDYDLDAAGLAVFHRERLGILAGAGADLVAFETFPSAVEAGVMVELLEEIPDSAAWISFTCRDGSHISDGTPIADVARRVGASRRIAAVGVNCTAPRHLATLIDALRAVTTKPIAVYPNSGERYDPEAKGWAEGEERLDLAAAGLGWAARGARILGGCCRTGPEDIRRLRARLLG